MHRDRRPRIWILTLLSLAGLHPASAGQPELLNRLLRLEADHGSLCPGLPGADAARGRLSEAAEVLRHKLSEIRSSTEGQTASISATEEATRVVASINEVVFNHLGIRPSQDLHDPCNLLLSSVLVRKQGYCVGIAAVYLVLAEQLELPIYAVATPSHVFLRYDDGAIRINVETFQNGAAVPDARYVADQRIAEQSIRRGIFLRVLTADQFLAQVHNNLGVIYSERGEFQRAAAQYKEALRLAPRLPAAWYNWGKDLQRQGDDDVAIRYFSKSLRLYPNDVWSLNNRGLAYRALGKEKKARRDFEEALRIDPGFEQARTNLGSAQSAP